MGKKLSEKTEFRLDPKGYILINVLENKIVVDHYSNQKVKLNTYEGTSSKEIYEKIVLNDTFSFSEHYEYIKKELDKAENSLKNKIKYIQA